MKHVLSFALVLPLILTLLAILIVGLFDGLDGVSLLHTLIFIDITISAVIYGSLLITRHTRR